jgi:hypothetical protein
METGEQVCNNHVASRRRKVAAAVGSLLIWLAGSVLASGCDSGAVRTATTPTGTGTDATTVTTPAYERQQVGYFLGVSEPRCYDLSDMARETDRLVEDNINTVGVLPPVLITERAGGRPRVILEGAAAAAGAAIDDFHDAGLAVFLSPTTSSPGYRTEVEPTETNLEHLKEDVLEWAATGEEKQVELLAPLERYNMVLGTSAADRWSRDTLPAVRSAFHGDIAASVVADLDGPPSPGRPHDFESLDLRGYDYLLMDISPQGEEYDEAVFRAYVTEVLDRAAMVAARDGLKGVLVSFGGWREATGTEAANGPLLGDEGQASAASLVLRQALPHAGGAFFYGWILPGRGARGFPVEDTLRQSYGQAAGGEDD